MSWEYYYLVGLKYANKAFKFVWDVLIFIVERILTNNFILFILYLVVIYVMYYYIKWGGNAIFN